MAIAAFVVVGAPAGAATPIVPGAPTVTSAVADVQNATISFTGPASDGGAPVFAYRATCTSSDGAFTASGNAGSSPIRVGGLSVGRVYTCTVAARNRVGLGVSSAPSAPFIPQLSGHRAVPGPPTSAVATAEVAGVRVGFGPPAYKVFGITSMYRAVCTSSDGGGPGSARKEHGGPIHVAHLTPGKTYTCYAQARNPYGWGSPSPRSNVVVPLRSLEGPAAPTITSVEAGVHRVAIGFDGPAPDAGGRITDYRATCTSSDGGAPATRYGRQSPVVVLSLSAGKTYTCTVTAHNRVGYGTASAPSAAVVPLSS
jgi:Fibronectin type III domain